MASTSPRGQELLRLFSPEDPPGDWAPLERERPRDGSAWGWYSVFFRSSFNIAGGGGLIPWKGSAKVISGVAGSSSRGGGSWVDLSSGQVAAKAHSRHAPKAAQADSEDGGGRAKPADLFSTSLTSR